MSQTPSAPRPDPEPAASQLAPASASLPASQPVSGKESGRAGRLNGWNTILWGSGFRGIGWEMLLSGSILVLALLLRLWHLSSITDNYDEGVYWASLRALHAGSSLFTPIFSSQPPFFLLSLLPLVKLLGPTLVAGRLGIVLFSLLGILAMYVLGYRLGGRWTGAGAALLLAVDHLYLMQSQTIQAEAPSTALIIVAIAAASFADRTPWQAGLLSGVATMLAIMTKLFAVVAVVPIPLLFLGRMLQMYRKNRAGAYDWALRAIGFYLFGLVATGILILLPYLGRLQPLYQQVIAFHLAAARSFPASLHDNLALILNTQAEYPLCLLAVLGGVIGLFRQRWLVLIAMSWVVAALIILLQQAPLFDHHLVLLVPGLALTASLGLAPQERASLDVAPAGRAAHHWSPLRRFLPAFSARGATLLRAGIPALLLCGVMVYALHTNLRYPAGNPAEQANALTAVANDLKALTTPDQQVIADDQYIADMAGRSVPPELVDTSFVRIETGYLTTAQVIALAQQPQVGAILFYTGRFDQLPGLRAWVEEHFHPARDYGGGRSLYLPGTATKTQTPGPC